MPLKTAMFCCEIPWREPLATWTTGPVLAVICGVAGDERSAGRMKARVANRMLEPFLFDRSSVAGQFWTCLPRDVLCGGWILKLIRDKNRTFDNLLSSQI